MINEYKLTLSSYCEAKRCTFQSSDALWNCVSFLDAFDSMKSKFIVERLLNTADLQ